MASFADPKNGLSVDKRKNLLKKTCFPRVDVLCSFLEGAVEG